MTIPQEAWHKFTNQTNGIPGKLYRFNCKGTHQNFQKANIQEGKHTYTKNWNRDENYREVFNGTICVYVGEFSTVDYNGADVGHMYVVFLADQSTYITNRVYWNLNFFEVDKNDPDEELLLEATSNPTELDEAISAVVYYKL